MRILNSSIPKSIIVLISNIFTKLILSRTLKLTPMHIKNILVPHAGTLGGDKALSDAIHLAKITGATINILHVMETTPVPPKFIFSSTERKTIQSELKNAENSIKKGMDEELKNRVKICKSKRINANYKVTTGIPENEIIKFSKEKGIDLIIMSKRRKIPGIKNFLKLGSVSRKILEVSKCPVLVIDA
jgi:nucleotide-binding universal stress UspA family protein